VGGKKIIIVGDYMWDWYQEACARALELLGCNVKRFGWFDDFRFFIKGISEPIYHSIWHRIQYRLSYGPIVWGINQRLISQSKKIKPDIIWFYNVTLISPRTLKKLRKSLPDTVFVQYSNDNPFSKNAKSSIWRNYINNIRYFDIHFAFRKSNLMDYKKYGSRNTFILMPYFIPQVDYPEPYDTIPNNFKCDVVFAGHYENDGRVEMLEAICKQGFNLKIFGGGWSPLQDKLSPNSPLQSFFPITPATGNEYRYAISGAKVALCFLSTLNEDTYTKRNFQIPAMKTVILSQYTDELAHFFIPDVEALFFNNLQELLIKLNYILTNENARTKIAQAGYDRVYIDGHDVNSRMKNWLNHILLSYNN